MGSAIYQRDNTYGCHTVTSGSPRLDRQPAGCAELRVQLFVLIISSEQLLLFLLLDGCYHRVLRLHVPRTPAKQRSAEQNVSCAAGRGSKSSRLCTRVSNICFESDSTVQPITKSQQFAAPNLATIRKRRHAGGLLDVLRWPGQETIVVQTCG